MSPKDLDTAIAEKEAEIEQASKTFDEEVEKLQKKYEELTTEKTANLQRSKHPVSAL